MAGEPFKTEPYALADGEGQTLYFEGGYFRILECTGATSLHVGVDDYGVYEVPVGVGVPVPGGFQKVRVENKSGGAVSLIMAVGAAGIDDDRFTLASGSLPVSDGGGSLTVDGAVSVNDGGGSLTVDGAVSVSNFPATQTVDGAVSVNDGGGSLTVDGAFDRAAGVSVAAVTVLATVTALVAANANRKAVTFQNLGSVDVYLGGATVSTANGLKIAAGADYTVTWTTAALYAISATAGQDVRVFEEV